MGNDIETRAMPDAVRTAGRFLWVIALVATTVGCRSSQAAREGGSRTERDIADAVFDVLSADREIYTKQVVNRLQNEEKVLKASEHWKDDKLLPLPAQMFRMGAERVRSKTKSFSYALLSQWPVNKQNAARTELEKIGLKAVVDNPAANHYGEETIAGVRYFTAVYADRAVSEACVSCHNNHDDSPRKDFKQGDVMGGVVIRIAMK